jgi:polysaccharide biosynthesis transport protein
MAVQNHFPRKGRIMANQRFRGGPIIGQMELWIVSVVLGSSLLTRSTWGADEEKPKTPPPQEKTGYTAKAYFLVSMTQPTILSPAQQFDEKEFEVLKHTQKELILSRIILWPVIRDTDIKQLPILARERDPVEWLSKNLSVTFPSNAEIMKITLTAPDAKDAIDIVNAVAKVYQDHLIQAEFKRRTQRIDKLDRVYQDAVREVRSLRSKIRNMADRFGGAEPEVFTLRQRLILDELSDARRRLAQIEKESEHIRMKIAIQSALAKEMRNSQITEIECLKYAAADPLLRRLGEEYAVLCVQKENQKKAVAPETKSLITESVEQAKKQYQDRIAIIREEIHDQRIREMRNQLNTYEVSMEKADQKQAKLEKTIDQLREQADQLGGTSVELEMYKSDSKRQEKNLEVITAEREKISAEIQAPSRITLLQKAEPTE